MYFCLTVGVVTGAPEERKAEEQKCSSSEAATFSLQVDSLLFLPSKRRAEAPDD